MKRMIKKKPGEASMVTWIKKRIDNNLNFLGIVTGSTGSAKSYTCLSIGKMIDPEFNPEHQVVFDFSDFMKAINKFNGVDLDYLEGASFKGTPLHKRKYKFISFEETHTSVNKRAWQSKINKLFLYLISTFRHQNIIVLFNMPYADYFDSSTMKLIHGKFECRGWSKKTKKSYVRPKLLQYNDKLSKFYEHSLHVIENNKLHKFAGLWGLPKPSEHIRLPYESMKTDFTNKMNAKITKDLLEMENPTKEQPIDKRKPLTPKQEEIMRALANIKETNKYEVCSKKLNLSLNAISCRRQLAEQKGYRMEEFVDDETL